MPTQITTCRGQCQPDDYESKKLGLSLPFGVHNHEHPETRKGKNHGKSSEMDGMGAKKDFPLPLDEDCSYKSILVGKARVLLAYIYIGVG